MIDCDVCSNQIGSIEEPIFLMPGEMLVCRRCYREETGNDPREEDAEYDGEDVSPEDIAKLFKS
jgi:ribosome-binding protein aMBF1 (putative translation factor)